jgi:hypothetical protein
MLSMKAICAAQTGGAGHLGNQASVLVGDYLLGQASR